MTSEPFTFNPPSKEPDWLKAFRKQSWKAYQSGSWENIDQESWRYVQPRDFLTVYASELSSTSDLDLHVDPHVQSCQRLQRQDMEIAKHVLAVSQKYSTKDRFRDLHGSLFDSALLVRVAPSEVVSTPIEVVPPITSGIPLILIHVASGSRATVVVHFLPGCELKQCHERLVCQLEKDASLEFVSFLQLGSETKSLHQHEFFLETGAQLQATYLPVGSELCRVVQEVTFLGKGSGAKTNGLIFGHGTQKFDFHAYQFHREMSNSELFFRNVATDHAKTVFMGNIFIDHGAKGTRAYQTNKNLVLSETAEAISLPKLEIDTDDVECGHGASVASLDENELFYLQSRGVPRIQAQKMIISGFYDAVVDRIPSKALRKQARNLLNQKLEKALS